MADIERTRTASRDRVLSNDEMVAVWNGDAGHPFNAAIKLLLLTGARQMEIGGLRWDEISDEGINLPASRDKEGKARIIPLSTAARTILDSIERRGEFVFERQQRGVTPPLVGQLRRRS